MLKEAKHQLKAKVATGQLKAKVAPDNMPKS